VRRSRQSRVRRTGATRAAGDTPARVARRAGGPSRSPATPATPATAGATPLTDLLGRDRLAGLGNQAVGQVLRSPVARRLVQRGDPSVIPPPAAEVVKDGEGNRIEQFAGRAGSGGGWYLAEKPSTSAFTVKDDADHRLIPLNPDASYLALRSRCEAIRDELLERATALKDADDLKWLFAKTYYYVTKFEIENVEAGDYLYPHMKMQEVIHFYGTYERNLDAWEAGKEDEVESNWKVAFEAAEDMNDGSWWRTRSHEITYALLPSIEAHVRFDLPRAIAAVYQTHYAGIPGASLGAFKADFFAMAGVFERASEAVGPEIEEDMWFVDPGSWSWLRDGAFPFMFHMGIERNQAWEKAEAISDYGGRGQEKLDRILRALIGTAHPYSGADAFHVSEGALGSGQEITDYDWLNQPGVTPDQPGHLPSPSLPVFPSTIYFRLGRPRREGAADSGVRADQDLDGLQDLADWTNQVRGARIEIVGRASSEGSEGDNLRLGRNRAVAIWFELHDRGADLTSNTLALDSQGETGAAPTREWRRVEITVTGVGQSKQQFTPPNSNLPSEVGP